MNKLTPEQKALLQELYHMLRRLDGQVMVEVPFSAFMPTKRKFRADYFLPQRKIIVEVNGGQYINGRHNRGGKGYENDLHKMNLAQRYGFRYFQFTYEMLQKQEPFNLFFK